MTHPKNASDLNQHPQNAAAIAISIAASTFVVHPLGVLFPLSSYRLMNMSAIPENDFDYLECQDGFNFIILDKKTESPA